MDIISLILQLKWQIQRVKVIVSCDISECLEYENKIDFLLRIFKFYLNMKASENIFTEPSLHFPELVLN